ncbi:hypothetical protein E3N88_14433 [Mikania micrantha]|uniref:Uncharacterized protein n=1 Tax=Mikania micrantha TaxID=192012 RepID=A0A5N6P3E1_9ASTR|nr:hypothetical protein E3N88_14433 [Mikania micrantha]
MLQHSEPTIIHQISEQSTSTTDRQQQDKDIDELFSELIRILLESIESVDNVHKCFLLRKIFLELENESQMENFIVEKLKHSQAKLICEFLERYQERSIGNHIGEDEVNFNQQETICCRGFKEDLVQVVDMTNGSKSQFSHKLERFKVKTIQIEGEPTIIHQISEQSTSTTDRQHQDKDIDELFSELIRVLFESIESVDNVHKCLLLRKIFLEIEKESQMDSFIVEKLKHSQAKLICEFLERYQERSIGNHIGEDEVNFNQQETICCRGFKEDLVQVVDMTNGSKSQFSHKLERFKVKTIQIEGGMIKK